MAHFQGAFAVSFREGMVVNNPSILGRISWGNVALAGYPSTPMNFVSCSFLGFRCKVDF